MLLCTVVTRNQCVVYLACVCVLRGRACNPIRPQIQPQEEYREYAQFLNGKVSLLMREGRDKNGQVH